MSAVGLMVVYAADGDPVCIDGGSCFSTIQEAIDNATAGSTITVAAGEYNQSKDSITISKPIILRGANSGVSGNSSRMSESIVHGNFLITNSSTDMQGITIDGFDIVNDGGTSFPTNAIRANGTATTKMLNISVINNRFVRSVRAADYTYEAVKFTGEYHNIQISNNYFSKNNIDVAFIGDTFTGLRQSDNLEVAHNVSSEASMFVNLAFTNQARIADNTITTSPSEKIFYIDGAVDGVNIERNTIYNGYSVLSINRANSGRRANRNIVFTHNNAINSTYGIYINSYGFGSAYSGALDATLNWWGTESGPKAADNVSGTGTVVNIPIAVAYQAWLCQPYEEGLRGSVDGSCDKLNLKKPIIEGFTQNNNDRSVINIGKDSTIHSNGEDPNKTRIVWSVGDLSDYGKADLKALRYSVQYPNDAEADWHQSGVYMRNEAPYEGNTAISKEFFTIAASEIVGLHGQGKYSFKLQTQDMSGQWSEWSDIASVSYLVQQPSATEWVISDSKTIVGAGYTNNQSGRIAWSEAGMGSASSYNYYEIAADTTLRKLDSQPDSLSEGEGVYNFCIKAVDENGNESDCSQITIVYDATEPVARLDSNLVKLEGGFISVYGYVYDANLDYFYCSLKDQNDHQIEGVGCGAVLMDSTAGRGAAHAPGMTLLANSSTSSLLGQINISGLADGVYNLAVVAVDLAGNRHESGTVIINIANQLHTQTNLDSSLNAGVLQDNSKPTTENKTENIKDISHTNADESSAVIDGTFLHSTWFYIVSAATIAVGILSWLLYGHIFAHKP